MMEFKYQGYRIKVNDTVKEICSTSWNKSIALNHPFKNTSFFEALENSFPQRKYAYLSVYQEDGKLVGLTVFTLDSLDLVLFSSAPVKKIAALIRKVYKNFLMVPLVTLGTMQTVGVHWWWDSKLISEDNFASIVDEFSKKIFPQGKLFVVRDFMSHSLQSNELESRLSNSNFTRILNLPLAVIYLNGMDSKAHYDRLRPKVRATIRKLPIIREKEQLKIEYVNDFYKFVEECYPLYLNLHLSAKDYQQEVIPIEFFYQLSRLPQFGITTARLADGQLVGFILNGFSDEIANPYLLGLNYEFSDSTLLYHQLLWNDIEKSADLGCEEVDLGLTSYFVKQKYGAKLEEMRMLVRFQNPFIAKVLNGLLPIMFKFDQPTEHRQFKKEE